MHYKSNDIQQGDPNEGVWNIAHYPQPRCLGNQTILLLREHHAIQGILQSEEYQRPCIWGWEREYAEGTIYELLFEKWMFFLKQSGGKQRTINKTANELAEIAKKGGLVASKSKRKPIILTTPDGKEIFYEVMNHACIEHDLVSGLLSKVAKGRQSHHRGYKVRYVEGV